MWSGGITKRHRNRGNHRQFIHSQWRWFVAEVPLPRWRFTRTKYTLECIGRTIMSWEMVALNRWPTEKMYRITVHFHLKAKKTVLFCFSNVFLFRLKIAFKFFRENERKGRKKQEGSFEVRWWWRENNNNIEAARAKQRNRNRFYVYFVSIKNNNNNNQERWMKIEKKKQKVSFPFELRPFHVK